MADNRAFLVHIPSGIAVGIGKMYNAEYWFLNDFSGMGDELKTFFEAIKNEENPMDIAIAMEEATHKYAIGKWVYGNLREDGLVQLIIDHQAL